MICCGTTMMMSGQGMMMFDRAAVAAHRTRAAARRGAVAPVLEDLAVRVLDRLDDTGRHFTRALEIGGRGVVAPVLAARGIEVISTDLAPAMAAVAGGPAIVADEEFLPFGAARFDLIVAHLSLHWVNDLPGALIQLRRALTPEGLFIASLPLLGTLGNLRAALIEAEAALTGGAAPRVSPFPELSDCAGLLQRAGFALPVAEREIVEFEYANPMALLRDLRDAGETNATIARSRTIPPREMVPMALASLMSGGRLLVALHLGILTGWGS
jgi:SAM-dependent methyltransferase